MSFKHPDSTTLDLGDSTFSDYHREFTALLASANASTVAAKSVSDPSPTSANQALDDADRDLAEASDLLKSLELESRSAPSPPLHAHVTSARDALSAAKRDLRAARMALAQRRDDERRESLLGGRGARTDRARMADATHELERGGDIIAQSRRHVAETEAVGASILEDLQNQRGTILRARENLGGVGGGLEESNSILSMMQRRAIMNRLVIYGVLAFVGVACAGIVYARIFHSRS